MFLKLKSITVFLPSWIISCCCPFKPLRVLHVHHLEHPAVHQEKHQRSGPSAEQPLLLAQLLPGGLTQPPPRPAPSHFPPGRARSGALLPSGGEGSGALFPSGGEGSGTLLPSGGEGSGTASPLWREDGGLVLSHLQE